MPVPSSSIIRVSYIRVNNGRRSDSRHEFTFALEIPKLPADKDTVVVECLIRHIYDIIHQAGHPRSVRSQLDYTTPRSSRGTDGRIVVRYDDIEHYEKFIDLVTNVYRVQEYTIGTMKDLISKYHLDT